MKRIIFIIAFLLTVSVNAQSKVTKDLGDFTTIKVYNGIEVELIKASKQKLEITGEKSEMVSVKNSNGTLKLALPFSLTPANNSADGKILIKVYYSKNIDIIDANEGATITGKDFKQDKVEIKAQERAFINLVLEVDNLKVKNTSGGIVKLTGKASNQDIDLDLYGVYHGFGLTVVNSSVVTSGTGAKAEILAGKTLNAKVSFGGSIFYKGNPEMLNNKKVIGGVIQKKD